MAAEERSIEEGPGKGKAFFDRAKTVAESGNYDYAIDMYIEGLKREPGIIAHHEALRRVSLERRVKGGKPAGGMFGPKAPMKGKTPKDQMLNGLWLLSKDPGNIAHMLAYIRGAAGAGYDDVVKWFAETVMLANKTKPKKDIYLEIAELYRKVKEFEKAADALQLAAAMDINDLDLLQKIKDVAAEAVMKKGKFDQGDDFKKSLKSEEDTKKLLAEDMLTKTDEYREQEVEKSQKEWEAAPLDHRAIVKYSTSLRSMEDEEHEAKAIEVLQKSYEVTKTYQYKKSIDEIKIKQYRRKLSAIRDEIKSRPDEAPLRERQRDLLREQLEFELGAYRDWSDHYPTDLTIRFDFGKRLFLSKHYDEAIGVFQEAQRNPKHRIETLYYLGLCFVEQKMVPEAMETFKIAVSEYDLAESGNDMAKRLYYALARVLEETGHIKEAIDIYSKLTRWEIGYKDARVRLGELRKRETA